jgi:ribosome-associated toxin RatA of RatAB toxin-antitoxin module
MTMPNLFIFTLIAFVTLFPVLQDNIFAEKSISFSKTLNVEKQVLQDMLIDIKNYENVFPDYIKSASILEESEGKVVTELSLGFGMIPLKAKVEHNILNDDTHELSVVSGDLRGTKIITTLEKTWGFDGVPKKGTIVHTDLSLQVSGFLALLGIIDDNLIHYSLDRSLLKLGDYSKQGFAEEVLKPNFVGKKHR